MSKYVQTPEPVKQVRFRAVFRAATEGIENADRLTPVLKSYRLFLYPQGGLRG